MMQNLPVIQINDPCSQDWENMSGDEQRRFCDSCQLQVLNFSEMTAAEVTMAMADVRSQRVCARVERFADGTVKTRSVRNSSPAVRSPRSGGGLRSLISQFGTLLAACALAGCSTKESKQPVEMEAVAPTATAVQTLGEVCLPVEQPPNEVDTVEEKPVRVMGRAMIVE